VAARSAAPYHRRVRVLVAPQEFKGSLTAAEAAAALAAGVRDALPDADIDEAPMSDGGAGLVDALLAARGGERIEAPVHDPLMRPARAAWVLLRDGSAAIEMAAASGLVLISPDERDPLRATTHGTGELMRGALDRRCHEIVVGVGGSATVDGGAGALQALGVRLLDAAGADLPPGGGALARLDRIDLSGRDARLAGVRVRVAADVTNALCGREGAAAVFGPQKGATPDDVAVLDAALARFAEVARRDCGADMRELSGAGAAGGLGAGLVACAGATIEPGFALVAEAAGLTDRIAAADVVVTGEGRLDAQTGYGKTVAGVAALARERGRPVVAVAGSIEGRPPGFAGTVAAQPAGMPLDRAMREARALVRAAAARALREFTGR
jgi:glycerate 2-kinase